MGELATVDIIVVSFNSGEFLDGCLDSIGTGASAGLAINILVVDNASTDGTPDRVEARTEPWIRLKRNEGNLGFAAAANIGIRETRGEYILLLNPDTVLSPDAVRAAVTFLQETDDAAIVSPKLVLQGGAIDPGCHRGFPTPWASFTYLAGLEKFFPKVRLFNGYHRWDLPLDEVHAVDAVSGAFMLFRRSLVDRIGLFDERFFMYAEDVDFCMRAKQAGGRVYYDPRQEVVHIKGTSTGIKRHSDHISQANLETRKRALNAFYDSTKLFYDKHYAEGNPRPLKWAVHLAVEVTRPLANWRLKRRMRTT
ncbi:MAG: glycosyltransferase family 2 protein [Dehalococcoidia bacterium]